MTQEEKQKIDESIKTYRAYSRNTYYNNRSIEKLLSVDRGWFLPKIKGVESYIRRTYPELNINYSTRVNKFLFLKFKT